MRRDTDEYRDLIFKCIGCDGMIISDPYKQFFFCTRYQHPEAKWALGNCPLASHLYKAKGVERKVNPLKASKRASK